MGGLLISTPLFKISPQYYSGQSCCVVDGVDIRQMAAGAEGSSTDSCKAPYVTASVDFGIIFFILNIHYFLIFADVVVLLLRETPAAVTITF